MPTPHKGGHSLALGLLILSACFTTGRVETPALPLEADRPDFTEGIATVPPGWIQSEAGYTFSRADGNTSHSIGELLVRIPAGNHAEGSARVQLLRNRARPGAVTTRLRGHRSRAESASLGADITPRLGGFFEWFGTNPASLGEKRQDYLNTGAAVRFGNSFIIDARVGANARRGTRDYFAGVGVSRRW